MFCRRFGSWPVAIHVGNKYRTVLEGPICKGNRITGWHTDTVQMKGVARRFPIGFSAFAFNTTMLWDPQRWNHPSMDSVAVHSGGRGGLQVSERTRARECIWQAHHGDRPGHDLDLVTMQGPVHILNSEFVPLNTARANCLSLTIHGKS
jgi:hypothetical protein